MPNGNCRAFTGLVLLALGAKFGLLSTALAALWKLVSCGSGGGNNGGGTRAGLAAGVAGRDLGRGGDGGGRDRVLSDVEVYPKQVAPRSSQQQQQPGSRPSQFSQFAHGTDGVAMVQLPQQQVCALRSLIYLPCSL